MLLTLLLQPLLQPLIGPLLSLAGSPAPEPPPAHSNYLLALAPEASVSVLAIGNLDEMRAAAKQNAFFRFAQDEEIAAFVNEIAGGALNELMAQADLEGALGPDVDLEAFFASLHGSIVLFSEMPTQDPASAVLGLMLELGEDRSGFDQLFNGLLERVKGDVKITGTDHLGVPLTTLRPNEPGTEGVLHVAELGNAVVMMGGAGGPVCLQELQGIVDRWAGASASGGLLQSASFMSGRESLGFDPNIEVHLKLPALWSLLENSGELQQSDLPAPLMKELGEVRWFHGGARIGAGEELELQVGLALPKEGILASFAGLFGGIPIDLLRQVPRQSASVSSLSLDLHGLFHRSLDLLHSFHEEDFAAVQAGLQQVADMGIDLEGDFLSQLTGGYVQFSIEVPPEESLFGLAGSMVKSANGDAPLPTYASATIIGVLDAARVEAGIDKLLAALDQPKLITELADGHPMNSVTLGPAAVHWAFTPASLILSLQPTPVKEALRMLSEDSLSIMDKGRFADPMAEHRRALSFSIRDTATDLKSILGGLQSASRMLPMLSMVTDFKLPKDFPINARTEWPSPSIVGRYFEGTLLTSLTWDENSLRYRISSK